MQLCTVQYMLHTAATVGRICAGIYSCQQRHCLRAPPPLLSACCDNCAWGIAYQTTLYTDHIGWCQSYVMSPYHCVGGWECSSTEWRAFQSIMLITQAVEATCAGYVNSTSSLQPNQKVSACEKQAHTE